MTEHLDNFNKILADLQNLDVTIIKEDKVLCDDLSEQVQCTSSFLVFNPTAFEWLRKGLKGKKVPFIIIKAFLEYLAKEFVRTSKLSVLQWEQSQDG